MADFLFTDLETDVRLSLQDTDGTQWTDAEVNNAINEARRFVLEKICEYNLFSTIMEQAMPFDIAHAEFCHRNEINLPEDFFWRIRLKEFGAESSIPFVSLDRQDDDISDNRAFVRASKVGAPVPATANAGVDTFETKGDNTGQYLYNYIITILAGGATFSWTRRKIATVALGSAPGTGYTVGDLLTVAGGTSGIVRVLTITGGLSTGPVGTVVLVDGGTGYTAGSNLATTGGTGTGCTITITVTGTATLSCSTSWQTLENGVKVKFGAATGFTVGDIWNFSAYPYHINLLRLNFDPTIDLELWYVRDCQPVALVSAAISTTARLEFRRYYDALKLYVEIKLRNRNEENVSQDMGLYGPVANKIMQKASAIGDEDQPELSLESITEDMI